MLQRYAIISVILHALVIMAALFGVLNYDTDVVDLAQPISVELVETIEDIAKTPDPIPEPEPKKENKPEQPPEKANPDPTPEPQAESDPEPEVVEVPEPKLEDPKPEPEPEAKPEPIPDAPQPKPKPPAPKPKPKKKPKKKPANDFDALLKNLTKSDSGPKANSGQLSEHLASSELDVVRKQIESVWRLPAGVKGIHTFTVSIKIQMNPDRTVRKATISSSNNDNDPAFRVLAESALRAVNEFKAKPLKLPPNRFKVWKEINMQFDPRHLL